MTKCLWPNGGFVPPRFYKQYPTGFRWTSGFGIRTDPVTGQTQSGHYGIDLIGFTYIKSAVNGVVTFSGYNGRAGYEVRIREHGTNDIFRDLHNSKLLVREGQYVTQGENIAIMGTTGSSTGIHCHHETRPGGGAPIDPMIYYANRNASTAGDNGSPITPKPNPDDEPEIDEDEMSSRPICVATVEGTTAQVRLFDQSTGEEDTYSIAYDAEGMSYIKNVALTYGCAPVVPVSYITKSHYAKIGRDNAERRARLRNLAVTSTSK